VTEDLGGIAAKLSEFRSDPVGLRNGRCRVMSNIVSGRQIRAARMLAGLTQAELARAAGCHPRSVRYWENKGSNPPTNVASTLDSIEQALNQHGVIPFSTPTPGVRIL
jgi:DNA-binding XRE family transcriptional regulator